mgnify:CR=1 FL=1
MFAQQHYFRIFTLTMSAILAFLMTGVISFIKTGLDTSYLLHWGRVFVIAWPIALSIVLMLGPHVRTIAEKLCTRDG